MRKFTDLTEEEIDNELAGEVSTAKGEDATSIIHDATTDDILIIEFSYPRNLSDNVNGNNEDNESGSESGSNEDNESIPIGTITFTIKDGKLHGALIGDSEQIDNLTKCFHIVDYLLKESNSNSNSNSNNSNNSNNSGGGSRKKKSKKSKKTKKTKKSRKSKKSRKTKRSRK
jgi:hypothetical protein